MNIGRRGFTLVELIIVLGLFAILVLGGSELVIQMVRANNQTVIQNEVRQNANRIIQLLTDSIRQANCVNWSYNGNDVMLQTFTDSRCAGIPTDTYSFLVSQNGRVLRNGQRIISDTVAACGDEGCASSCTKNGLEIGGTPGSGAIGLKLTLQQTPRPGLRRDFCGRVTLTSKVTPRQY